MNKTTQYIIAGAIFLAIFLAFPLILKGVVVSTASIMLALVFAGVFLLGMCIALAITSPLWIPFLAGWAVVNYCKNQYKKNDVQASSQ